MCNILATSQGSIDLWYLEFGSKYQKVIWSQMLLCCSNFSYYLAQLCKIIQPSIDCEYRAKKSFLPSKSYDNKNISPRPFWLQKEKFLIRRRLKLSGEKKLIARNNFVKSWLYFGFGFSKKFGLKRGQREIVADQKVFCVVSKVVRYRAVVVILRYWKWGKGCGFDPCSHLCSSAYLLFYVALRQCTLHEKFLK